MLGKPRFCQKCEKYFFGQWKEVQFNSSNYVWCWNCYDDFFDACWGPKTIYYDDCADAKRWKKIRERKAAHKAEKAQLFQLSKSFDRPRGWRRRWVKAQMLTGELPSKLPR